VPESKQASNTPAPDKSKTQGRFSRFLGPRKSQKIARKAKRWNATLIFLAVLGIVTLAGVIYLAPLVVAAKHPRWAVVLELAERMADAALVAAGLALLVDLPAKIEMMREVLYEASAHIIGRNLPEDIREQVRTYLTTPFIRPSWLVDYRLSLIDGKHAVKLHAYLEGEIQNCGGQPADFNFIGEVDIGKSKILKVGMLRGEEEIFMDRPTDDQQKEWHNEAGTIHFERQQTIAVNETLTTVFECEEYRPNAFLHPLITSSMVRTLTVTIIYPVEDLTVELDLSCGKDGKVVRRDFADGTRWHITKPLLPGQTVITSWKPKVSEQISANHPPQQDQQIPIV